MTTTLNEPTTLGLQRLFVSQTTELTAVPGGTTTVDISVTVPGDLPTTLPFTAQTFTAPTGFTFDYSKLPTYAYYLPLGETGHFNPEGFDFIADHRVLVLWAKIELNTSPTKGAQLTYTLPMIADKAATPGTHSSDGSVTIGLYGGAVLTGNIVKP